MLDLVPDRLHHLVRTVADPVLGARLPDARPIAGVVAVAAGDPEAVADRHHPGPHDPAALHRAPDRHVGERGRADVADRREAGLDRAARVLRRAQRALAVALGHPAVLPVALEVVAEVGVGVDQPRQQRSIAEVDHRRAGRRLAADRGDPAVLDHHHRAGDDLSPFDVQHAVGPDDHEIGRAPAHGRLLGHDRRSRRERSSRSSRPPRSPRPPQSPRPLRPRCDRSPASGPAREVGLLSFPAPLPSGAHRPGSGNTTGLSFPSLPTAATPK